jgi:hypothetical protein
VTSANAIAADPAESPASPRRLAPVPQPTPTTSVDQPTAVAVVVENGSKRVKNLTNLAAEAKDLQALQQDINLIAGNSPEVVKERLAAAKQEQISKLGTDSAAVIKARRKVEQAAKMQRLRADPAWSAYVTTKVRKAVTAVAAASLTGALTWSTVGVAATLTGHVPTFAAWLAEPTLASAVLMLFAFRAFCAATDRLFRSTLLNWAEGALLGLSLFLNVGPYLMVDAVTPNSGDWAGLLGHLVGPLTAVLIVLCMPHVWAGLNQAPADSEAADPDMAAWLPLVRMALADGTLPPNFSQWAMTKVLRTDANPLSKETATRIYKRLTGR